MTNFTTVILFVFLFTDIYALMSSHKSMSILSFTGCLAFVVTASIALTINFINKHLPKRK